MTMAEVPTTGCAAASHGRRTSEFVLTGPAADQVRAQMDDGNTLPLWWYRDDDVADAEQRRIFRRSWHYVGHTQRLAEPGDFFTCDLAGVPIVVARDMRGELRALHNVCRHRASIVVPEESGRRRLFQCPYHAWTYELDGRLNRAPRSDRESAFDKEQLGLRRACVDTWGPFVFVHLDRQAPPLRDSLGQVPALVAEAGIDVDQLRFHSRADYDLACNWKVAMENYLECYHCPTAHPGLSAVLDTRADAYRLELGANFAWQNGPLRDLAPSAKPQAGYTGRDGRVAEGRYFAIWPSMKINVNPGRQNLSIGPMIPAEPGSCHGILDYYFGADADEAWIDGMFEFDNQVGAQDVGLVEAVQRGIASGSVEAGHVMRASEWLISGFQRYVVEALTEPAGDPSA